MTGLRFDGVSKMVATLDAIGEAADRETRRAVGEGLAVIERQAKINSAGRPGPNVRTGAHRRGIRSTPVTRVGTFQWQGTVGPTVVYSRRLELGGGNWPPDTKFPYFLPAVGFAVRTALPVIFKRAWARATKKAA